MIAHHYPGLFAEDPEYRGKAEALAAKTHELVSFLAEVRGMTRGRGALRRHRRPITTAARACGSSASGRSRARCSAACAGLTLKELADRDVCCGFGGTFCVKYPDISLRMVGDKVRDIAATGADTVLAGDMGCLLNIAGRLKREGCRVKVRHVAEVLAGRTGGRAGDRRGPGDAGG